MLEEIITHSPEETRNIGKKFAEGLQDNDVVAIYGELGAGKTQFIKGICTHFGVKDTVSSPSFIIVNEYISKRNLKIFHFDFYRVKDLDEIINIGFTEYLNSGGLLLIEWPNLVENILPPDTKKILITHKGDNESFRNIKIMDT